MAEGVSIVAVKKDDVFVLAIEKYPLEVAFLISESAAVELANGILRAVEKSKAEPVAIPEEQLS